MAVSQKSHRLAAGLAGSGALNAQSRLRLAPYVFSKFDCTGAGGALSASAAAGGTSSTPAATMAAQRLLYSPRRNIGAPSVAPLNLLYGNCRRWPATERSPRPATSYEMWGSQTKGASDGSSRGPLRDPVARPRRDAVVLRKALRLDLSGRGDSRLHLHRPWCRGCRARGDQPAAGRGGTRDVLRGRRGRGCHTGSGNGQRGACRPAGHGSAGRDIRPVRGPARPGSRGGQPDRLTHFPGGRPPAGTVTTGARNDPSRRAVRPARPGGRRG